MLSATLTVQPNAKWHNKPPVNGRQVDAQDIAYNLLRITGALEPDEGQRARYQRRSTLTGMENAEAVDNEVVRVTFDRPTGTFLGGLSDFRNLMAPRDFLDGGGEYEDTPSVVGSGPFIIESFKGDERATWVRNPDYWRPGLPSPTWTPCAGTGSPTASASRPRSPRASWTSSPRPTSLSSSRSSGWRRWQRHVRARRIRQVHLESGRLTSADGIAPRDCELP